MNEASSLFDNAQLTGLVTGLLLLKQDLCSRHLKRYPLLKSIPLFSIIAHYT